jgi:hypothetical protein
MDFYIIFKKRNLFSLLLFWKSVIFTLHHIDFFIRVEM